jgi:hypothetical protein
MLRTAFTNAWRTIGFGWRRVSDLSNIAWLASFLPAALPAAAVGGALQYWGEHSIALSVIAGTLVFGVAFLIVLGLLGQTRSLSQGDNQARDVYVARFAAAETNPLAPTFAARHKSPTATQPKATEPYPCLAGLDPYRLYKIDNIRRTVLLKISA